MFCSNCGFEANGVIFCPACGQRLQYETENVSTDNDNDNNNYYYGDIPAKQKRKKNFALVKCLIMAIVDILLVVAAFFGYCIINEFRINKVCEIYAYIGIAAIAVSVIEIVLTIILLVVMRCRKAGVLPMILGTLPIIPYIAVIVAGVSIIGMPSARLYDVVKDTPSEYIPKETYGDFIDNLDNVSWDYDFIKGSYMYMVEVNGTCKNPYYEFDDEIRMRFKVPGEYIDEDIKPKSVKFTKRTNDDCVELVSIISSSMAGGPANEKWSHAYLMYYFEGKNGEFIEKYGDDFFAFRDEVYISRDDDDYSW